jgi:hypothetical protein
MDFLDSVTFRTLDIVGYPLYVIATFFTENRTASLVVIALLGLYYVFLTNTWRGRMKRVMLLLLLPISFYAFLMAGFSGMLSDDGDWSRGDALFAFGCTALGSVTLIVFLYKVIFKTIQSFLKKNLVRRDIRPDEDNTR